MHGERAAQVASKEVPIGYAMIHMLPVEPNHMAGFAICLSYPLHCLMIAVLERSMAGPKGRSKPSQYGNASKRSCAP